MTNVIFVCQGNTCRSPMAEFVMKNLVKKAGMAYKIGVSSAGVAAKEGKDISEGTRTVFEKYHIPFTEHKSTQFKAEDYAANDYIIGIDRGNVDDILKIVGGDAEQKIYLLMDFTDEKKEVTDPFISGDYDGTYTDILKGCQALLTKICRE